MFPVRYELCFICQKTSFSIVTAVRTSNLTVLTSISLTSLAVAYQQQHYGDTLTHYAHQLRHGVRVCGRNAGMK
jgi:hypothetical protein